MITYTNIENAKDLLIEEWGADGVKVIQATKKVKKFDGTLNEFLDNCTACGGNFTGMYLTGLEKLYPSVVETIPTHLGKNSFYCICAIMTLCGIDIGE